MTTQQLTAIAPEWVVAKEGEIRPVCPYPATDENYATWILWHEHYGPLCVATDLTPGTYKAGELVVVWQYRMEGDEQRGWCNSVMQHTSDWTYGKFKLYNNESGFETRLFITKA